MFSSNNLQEPLVGDIKERHHFSMAALPMCMFFSACGMILLKLATVHSSARFLFFGYVCEVAAFGIYPASLDFYTLRFVSCMWATSSIFTGVLCGYFMFSEVLTPRSLVGCLMVVSGIGLQAS